MMESLPESRRGRGISDERGGSRVNFLIVLLIIAVVGYALSQYAPVAYKAYLFKDYMQETVNRAAFPPGQSTNWVEQQLRASSSDYDLPSDMNIATQKVNGRVEARVRWSRDIPLPGYVYEYKFDHTARSSGFLNPQN